MARVKKALTKTQIKKLKDKLEAQLEDVKNENLKSNEHYHLDKNELSDPLDEASENITKSHELRLRNRNIKLEKKIKKTLIKIEKQEYGMCDECDEPIGFERLWARPVADMCITCKEESEKDENSTITGRKSGSLGVALHEMAR